MVFLFFFVASTRRAGSSAVAWNPIGCSSENYPQDALHCLCLTHTSTISSYPLWRYLCDWRATLTWAILCNSAHMQRKGSSTSGYIFCGCIQVAKSLDHGKIQFDVTRAIQGYVRPTMRLTDLLRPRAMLQSHEGHFQDETARKPSYKRTWTVANGRVSQLELWVWINDRDE